MANVQHAGLVSAECHEPKLITDTLITDTGKVITPSGTLAGTSELRKLKFSEIDRSTVPHINLEIVNNSSADARTIAGDLTLHTSADYEAITRWTEGLTNPSVGVAFNDVTGEMTISETGIYRGDLWLSASSDTASTLGGVRYAINGNFFPAGASPVVKALTKTAGDIVIFSGFGEVPLTAGQVLTVGFAVNKSASITIHESAFTLRRVA